MREVSLSDLSFLMTIEAACFSSDCISKRQMHYLIQQAKRIFFVIEMHAQVVAYAITLLPQYPRPARLYSLAVLPTWQGQGFAKQLLLAHVHAAKSRGYDTLRLEVAVANHGARALYQQLGFYPIAHLSQYYLDGTDAVRMALCLKSY